MNPAEELLGAIARGWCHPKNEGKVFDPDLAIAIAAEVNALRASPSEAVERDAARYRWLRSAGWFDDAIMESEHMNELFPETIDRAIDDALDKGRSK